MEAQVSIDQEHADHALTALHVGRDLRLLPGLEARRSRERDPRQLIHQLHVGQELLPIGRRHLRVRARPVLDGPVVLGLLHLAGHERFRLAAQLLLVEGGVTARARGRQIGDVAERPPVVGLRRRDGEGECAQTEDAQESFHRAFLRERVSCTAGLVFKTHVDPQ